jgi:hypothetical protein
VKIVRDGFISCGIPVVAHTAEGIAFQAKFLQEKTDETCQLMRDLNNATQHARIYPGTDPLQSKGIIQGALMALQETASSKMNYLMRAIPSNVIRPYLLQVDECKMEQACDMLKIPKHALEGSSLPPDPFRTAGIMRIFHAIRHGGMGLTPLATRSHAGRVACVALIIPLIRDTFPFFMEDDPDPPPETDEVPPDVDPAALPTDAPPTHQRIADCLLGKEYMESLDQVSIGHSSAALDLSPRALAQAKPQAGLQREFARWHDDMEALTWMNTVMAYDDSSQYATDTKHHIRSSMAPALQFMMRRTRRDTRVDDDTFTEMAYFTTLQPLLSSESLPGHIIGVDIRCPIVKCNRPMNIGGAHALKCKYCADFWGRHNAIVGGLTREMATGTQGRIRFKKEPYTANYLDHLGGPAIGEKKGVAHKSFATTRADIAFTISGNAQPTTILIDVVTTSINTEKITDAAEIAEMDGRMAEHAEKKKYAHYKALVAKPENVIPFAVEAGGRMGVKAEKLLRRLARLATPKASDGSPAHHEIGMKLVKLRTAIAFANAKGVALARISLRQEIKRLCLRENTNKIGDCSHLFGAGSA